MPREGETPVLYVHVPTTNALFELIYHIGIAVTVIVGLYILFSLRQIKKDVKNSRSLFPGSPSNSINTETSPTSNNNVGTLYGNGSKYEIRPGSTLIFTSTRIIVRQGPNVNGLNMPLTPYPYPTDTRRYGLPPSTPPGGPAPSTPVMPNNPSASFLYGPKFQNRSESFNNAPSRPSVHYGISSVNTSTSSYYINDTGTRSYAPGFGLGPFLYNPQFAHQRPPQPYRHNGYNSRCTQTNSNSTTRFGLPPTSSSYYGLPRRRQIA